MAKKSSVPPAIRDAPDGYCCYVCRSTRDDENPLSVCAGGCGLHCHEACEGMPPVKPGKGRKRKAAGFRLVEHSTALGGKLGRLVQLDPLSTSYWNRRRRDGACNSCETCG